MKIQNVSNTLLVMLLGIFGLLFLLRPSESPVPLAPTRSAQRVQVPDVLNEQNVHLHTEQRLRIREYHLRILSQSVGNDPEGQELMRFYENETDYLTVLPNGNTLGSPEVTGHQKIPVIVMNPEQRAEIGLSTAADWVYEQDFRRILTPTPERYSDFWAGLFLAHEVSHARQYAINNMTGNDYVAEEVRVHRLETRLLNLRSQGQYLARINNWIDQHPQLVDNGCFIVYDHSLTEALADLFPSAINSYEYSVQAGSYTMAVNEVLSDRHPEPNQQLAHCYNVMRSRL